MKQYFLVPVLIFSNLLCITELQASTKKVLGKPPLAPKSISRGDQQVESDLQSYRELFPGMSDKEILELLLKTNEQNLKNEENELARQELIFYKNIVKDLLMKLEKQEIDDTLFVNFFRKK